MDRRQARNKEPRAPPPWQCNTDPQALPLAVAAFQTYHQFGTPESELAIAQCCVYLAVAPKSNAVSAASDRP